MRIRILLLLILPGCSAVHNAQMQNVKAFAKSSQTLSSAPAELYHDISDFRQELRLVENSTLFTADKIIPRLNQSLVMQQAFEDNVSRVRDACELISIYSECLMCLVGAEKDLEDKTFDLSIRLGSVLNSYNRSFEKKIPASVGNLLGMVVMEVGSMHLKKLQNKYLPGFINSGAVIVSDVCDYFTGEVNVSLTNELQSLDAQLNNVMTNFYDNIEVYEKKQNVNPFNYYKYYNPLYLHLRQTLTTLNSLQQKTMTAMQKIKATHEKLRSAVNTHMEDGLMAEVKDLYFSLQEIKRDYDKLKTIQSSK